MKQHLLRALGAGTTAACLLAPTAAAQAASLSIAPSGTISATATARAPISFMSPTIGTTCALTLGGSLASSVPGVGGRAGSFTSGTSGGCAGGVGLTFPRLPWQLDVFQAGTTTTVSVHDFSYVLDYTMGVVCLYGGTVNATISGSSPVTVANLVVRQTLSYDPAGSSVICPVTNTVSGSFDLVPDQTVTAVP